MRSLDDNNPELKINFYNVNQDSVSWKAYLDDHGIGSGAVPRTQIGAPFPSSAILSSENGSRTKNGCVYG